MTCEPHQRHWRELCVDKGLRDEWLEKINALRYWKPYSTCEGHFDRIGGGADDHPRVWLLLDEKFTPTISKMWDANVQEFQRLREDCFPANDTISRLDFERDSKIFATTCGLHLDSRVRRQSIEMSTRITEWWENTIRRLEKFDHEFGQILCGKA
jgi:hypothetical protein